MCVCVCMCPKSHTERHTDIEIERERVCRFFFRAHPKKAISRCSLKEGSIQSRGRERERERERKRERERERERERKREREKETEREREREEYVDSICSSPSKCISLGKGTYVYMYTCSLICLRKGSFYH